MNSLPVIYWRLAAIFAILAATPSVAVKAGGMSLFGFPSSILILAVLLPIILLFVCRLGSRRNAMDIR